MLIHIFLQLIQAGKHFRVIAKDGPGALVGTHGGIQAKTSDSLSQYHLALNDIESEIVREILVTLASRLCQDLG